MLSSTQSDREPHPPGPGDRAANQTMAGRRYDSALDRRGMLEAERHLRKLAGCRALPGLTAVLHACDVALDPARRVDNRKPAA